MARYKGSGPNPFAGQRLDGQVWQPSGSGGTIRGWCSPHGSPSLRFSEYDKYASDLDLMYDKLAPWQVQWWETNAILPGFKGLCQLKWLPLAYWQPGVTGQAYHGSVNMHNKASGLPYTPTPPTPTVDYSNDRIEVYASGGPNIIWERDLLYNPPEINAFIYARAAKNKPEGAGSLVKYKMCGVVKVKVYEPAPLINVLAGKEVLLQAGWAALVVGLVEPGNAPFYFQKCGCRLPV